jgi:hypothetical protein
MGINWPGSIDYCGFYLHEFITLQKQGEVLLAAGQPGLLQDAFRDAAPR